MSFCKPHSAPLNSHPYKPSRKYVGSYHSGCMLTFLQQVSYVLHITCLLPNSEVRRLHKPVTTVQDCVSTFLSVNPTAFGGDKIDILDVKSSIF